VGYIGEAVGPRPLGDSGPAEARGPGVDQLGFPSAHPTGARPEGRGGGGGDSEEAASAWVGRRFDEFQSDRLNRVGSSENVLRLRRTGKNKVSCRMQGDASWG